MVAHIGKTQLNPEAEGPERQRHYKDKENSEPQIEQEWFLRIEANAVVDSSQIMIALDDIWVRNDRYEWHDRRHSQSISQGYQNHQSEDQHSKKALPSIQEVIQFSAGWSKQSANVSEVLFSAQFETIQNDHTFLIAVFHAQ